MADEPFEAEIIIVRKPAPPEPTPFVCVCCERSVQPDRWDRTAQRSPICSYCEKSWTSRARIRPTGITRGDHRTLQRLSAITTRLQWETINGRRPS